MSKRLTSRFGTKVPSSANDRNVVLTGPGRSGTTLSCYLLNKLPNTLALIEPISPGRFADRMPDREAVADGIEAFYRGMRRRALEERRVKSKHVGGRVPDNTKGTKDGGRGRIAEKGWIAVDKELEANFYLAIKQPAMFTALLPTLVRRFPCYAVVRNPLSIMGSAGSLQRGEQRKNAPALLRYDPEAARYLETAGDPVELRIRRLDYFFGRYLKHLPHGHVIRYEDIVASGGEALSAVVPAARELDEPLVNRNSSPLYGRERMLELGERLLESEGAYWRLYSRGEVREIMENLG